MAQIENNFFGKVAGALLLFRGIFMHLALYHPAECMFNASDPAVAESMPVLEVETGYIYAKAWGCTSPIYVVARDTAYMRTNTFRTNTQILNS